MPSEVADALDAGVVFLSDKHGVKIDDTARDLLLRYIALLAKWNKVYNLTAVRDPVAMVWRHLVDSLLLGCYLPDSEYLKLSEGETDDTSAFDVIDIGSGAGLPVLPLAILRPQLQFMSIESNGKKTRFQQQACLELGIGNVDVVNRRVEEVQARAGFVTSRAFTAPAEFLHIAHNLCAERALVAVMLANTDTVPESLPLNFTLQELVPVDIPRISAPRHIALCQYNA